MSHLRCYCSDHTIPQESGIASGESIIHALFVINKHIIHANNEIFRHIVSAKNVANSQVLK